MATLTAYVVVRVLLSCGWSPRTYAPPVSRTMGRMSAEPPPPPRRLEEEGAALPVPREGGILRNSMFAQTRVTATTELLDGIPTTGDEAVAMEEAAEAIFAAAAEAEAAAAEANAAEVIVAAVEEEEERYATVDTWRITGQSPYEVLWQRELAKAAARATNPLNTTEGQLRRSVAKFVAAVKAEHEDFWVETEPDFFEPGFQCISPLGVSRRQPSYGFEYNLFGDWLLSDAKVQWHKVTMPKNFTVSHCTTILMPTPSPLSRLRSSHALP